MTKQRKKSKSQKSQSSNELDFNPDYSDVIKDLKRIGSLAGFFFIVLITLSFVLN